MTSFSHESDSERAARQAAAVSGQPVEYEMRLNELYAVVRTINVHGASCSAIATRLGWSTYETRGKLMSLRKRDCVFYEDGVWFT